jgi:hypothetical protein
MSLTIGLWKERGWEGAPMLVLLDGQRDKNRARRRLVS